MLDGQPHGRHPSHAKKNPQENSSSTGNKNYQAGIFFGVHRNETGALSATK
jgi:hypothetical protein